jgi:hypothetical protein
MGRTPLLRNLRQLARSAWISRQTGIPVSSTTSAPRTRSRAAACSPAPPPGAAVLALDFQGFMEDGASTGKQTAKNLVQVLK